MFALKRIISAVLVLSSTAVTAGAMGPACTPGDVSVSCARSAWSFAAQALYLQTNFNKDFSFYPRGENGIFSNLSGQWNWGFQLEAAYQFNTGNDVAISWYHLHTKTSHFKFNPFGTFDPLNLSLALKNQWDAVNGELAQNVTFSTDTQVRLHGGFQFSRIKNTTDGSLTTVFPDPFFLAPALTAPNYLAYRTQYNGFGPRVGIDMSYFLGRGFGMYAKAATALLVGTSKYSVSGLLTNTLSTPQLVHGFRTALVPEIEAKVGLDYAYPTARGDFIFDLGYMWTHYFNPLNNQNIIENIANNQSFTKTNSTTDFSLSGIYFGVKYLGPVSW